MTPALDAVRREELRAKALAATPGPWTVGGGWTDHGSRWTGILVEFGDDVIGESGTASDADWAYIAAMSPDTTLALFAYIAELEARNMELEAGRARALSIREGNDMLDNEPVLFVAGYERAWVDVAAALLPKASVREERNSPDINRKPTPEGK